jgi:hypothetical protein
MKVYDFDDREYNWPPSGHEVDIDDRRKRSDLHLRTRAILKSLYPTQSVLEEVPLPGMRLFLDFFLPSRKVCIEVHGQQHYNYTEHFHGDKMGFLRAKANDNRKIEWCHHNNLRIVELPYNESDDDWREKIIQGGN